MNEEWRPVPDAETRYEISSLGRIRSLVSKTPRILKQRADRDGYKRVNVVHNGKHTTLRIHRLVAEAFHGPCPEGCVPDHINRVRDDNRPANLRFITASDNNRKLTDDTIRTVKRLLACGWPQQRIADHVGHAQSVVSEIKLGKRWREVV